jgi:prepilin-type N-terminal cleavage/methylation domain-containing protein/prepilin-type processing-associated H-X9-DG protein
MGIVKTKRGFTLIELLVVIAIIALLLSILMPSLGAVKDHAKKIHCSANLKSMSLAAMMYADAHDGRTPSSTNEWSNKGTTVAGWCGRTFGRSIDVQISNLEKSQLWTYIETTKAWSCPQEPDKELLTTYCMSGQWWGVHARPGDSVWYDPGTTGLVCKKISDVGTPSNRFLFIDQLGRNFDSYYALWYSKPQWWNIPNYRHGGGSVNGFADGHVEGYKLTKETAKMAEEAADGDGDQMSNIDMTDSADLKYYQRGVWGKWSC